MGPADHLENGLDSSELCLKDPDDSYRAAAILLHEGV